MWGGEGGGSGGRDTSEAFVKRMNTVFINGH